MTVIRILLIFLVSCLLSNNFIAAQQIQKFESSLGKKRTKAINEIVKDFEKYLNTNFSEKSLDANYQKYLEDFSNGEISREWRISDSKMKKYNKLELFDKFGITRTDTVWYDGTTVNYIWEDDDLIQSIILFNNANLDSIIYQTKNEIFIKMIVDGRFYIALETISSENPFVEASLEWRYIIISMLEMKDENYHSAIKSQWQYLISLFLDAKPDFSDYFIRRIIAIGTYEFEYMRDIETILKLM